MTDDQERYARTFEVLSGAHELDGESLEAYLEEACAHDEPLRARVLELLAACSDTQAERGSGDAFADASLAATRRALDDLVTTACAAWMPEVLGDYRILRQIGRGGMGVVYEAEQASPRRRVALKLLNPMHATGDGLRRFQREAEVLGRLQHPGIAQIYEASTLEAGHGQQAFFAMELVEGLPITEYATRNRLTTTERLALVADLCDIIQYPHERGVIHRDLKPANILVSSMETGVHADSVPGSRVPAQLKVLDFGIAHIADSDLSTSTLQTSTGEIIGTISHMSPEQASGQPGAVDVRSDVYSLGVLTYELLTAVLPLPTEGLMLHDAVRALREEEPTRLGGLNPSLRGDIETIVGKALEKEPARRYGSAAEMAADLRRFLKHQPIHARPPSAMYRLRKFTKRNKVLVGGVTTTLFVAIVGAIVAIGYALESQRRADEMERVVEFYSNQWSRVDLGAMTKTLREEVSKAMQRESARGADSGDVPAKNQELEPLIDGTDFARVTMRFLDESVFSSAQATLEAQFVDVPLVQARLSETLSETIHRLGLVQRAAVLQKRALELNRSELGDFDPRTLRSLSLMGCLRRAQGDYSGAARDLSLALERQRMILPPTSQDVRDSLTWLGLAVYHVGTPEEYLAIQRERAAIEAERVGPKAPSALLLLADERWAEGRLEDAADLTAQALAGYRQAFGDRGVSTLVVIGNLASILHEIGELEGAEVLAREMVAGTTAQLGAQHPATTNAMCLLGQILRDGGKLDEAEPLLRDALSLRERYLGPEDQATLESRRQLDLLLKARSGREGTTELPE